MRAAGDERGQALLLLVATLAAVLAGATAIGALAQGLGARDDRQRAADLAALAAGRAMHGLLPRRLEPATIDGRPNPRHLPLAAYVAQARAAAQQTARRNGVRRVGVAFPGGGDAPTRVRVVVADPIRTPAASVAVEAVAEAEVGGVTASADGWASGGGYSGPLAMRQGKGMRPDVALAFDRMAAAARADGVRLTITSAFRSDAEQAVLWARNPDPRMVAPPGRSLHRFGTELDLGPRAAYPWLARHARRFGFVQRYSWEWWHWGFVRSPGSASVGFGGRARAARGGSAVPGWVPAAYEGTIRRAAIRHGVGAALLAAQLKAESNFDPRARSPAGALGIAQFMPATARDYGLRDPFDPDAAIDAQARHLRDLLGRFGSVPLALAAYNAGPGAVGRCGCVPPYRETQAYVAKILALLDGRDLGALATGGPAVRLVR